VRDYPAVSLASVVPFPALVHETLLAPFAHPRDPGGLNGFLEDTLPLRRAGVPYLLAPGNHDSYHRADLEPFARYFGPPGAPERDVDALWYSVDLAGWRFLVLDTGTDLLGDRDPMPAGGPQLAWLDDRLADAAGRGLRAIVVLHIPPFSSGREEGGAPWIEERVVKGVLDRHPVALVVSGHVHAYERLERPGLQGRPVTYVVSGGAGGRFFHPRKERDPRSLVFVEEVRHYLWLELGPDGIRGEMIPVGVTPEGAAREAESAASRGAESPSRGPGTPRGAEPLPGDRFTIDAR
jgi:3',5'-cyclic AMP phosphodiesterase CpdA